MARDDNQTKTAADRPSEFNRGERLAMQVRTQIDHLEPWEQESYYKRLAYEAAIRTGGEAVQQGSLESLKYAGPIGIGGQELSLENIEEAMTYQPMDGQQIEAAQEIRDALTFAAKAILRRAPRSARRTLALQHVINARMDANAAISFRGRF